MTKQPTELESNHPAKPGLRDFIVTVTKRGEPDQDIPVEAVDEADAVRLAYQAAGVAQRTEAYNAVATSV